jgi:hypothetical protein
MGWEQRLRDLLLAASAVAAGGCAAPTAGPGAPDNIGDATDAEQGEDASNSGTVVFCCNADPDPCCGCAPDQVQDPVACGEKMACEADGGTWVDGRLVDPPGPPCTYPQEAGSGEPSSARDASQAHEAGPGDGSNADVFDAGDANGSDAAD